MLCVGLKTVITPCLRSNFPIRSVTLFKYIWKKSLLYFYFLSSNGLVACRPTRSHSSSDFGDRVSISLQVSIDASFRPQETAVRRFAISVFITSPFKIYILIDVYKRQMSYDVKNVFSFIFIIFSLSINSYVFFML